MWRSCVSRWDRLRPAAGFFLRFDTRMRVQLFKRRHEPLQAVAADVLRWTSHVTVTC